MARTALFSRYRPGGLFTISNIEEHPGNIYFVDSVTGTNAATGGNSPDTPFASIAYAFSSDRVTTGDVVYVLPTHVETIAGAAGIAADIAGVKVIGLGWGTKRPTLTWSATDSTIAVSAASVQFKNIRCACSIDEVVTMWNWTGASGVMDAVDFHETTSAQAIAFYLSTSGASDMLIKNCKHHQVTASASNAKWISPLGARTTIQDNIIHLTLTSNSASQVIANSSAALDLTISRNRIVLISAAGLAISVHASSTGIVDYNNVISTGTLAGKVALGGASGIQNYVATTANKSGIIDPVVA